MIGAINMLMKAKYGILPNAEIDVSVTDTCPNCGKGIEPVLKSSTYYNDIDCHIIYLTLFCNSCKYAWVDSYNYVHDSMFSHTYPKDIHWYKGEVTNLSSDIKSISPRGVQIYNQSLEAEKDGYDTLVGIGLRKSLEFFLKDYLILKNPEQKEDILGNLLGKVIATYIEDASLLALAKATSWIGNDETHYVRKHTDRDLQDLKKFINAVIRFIEYQLTISDAHDLMNSPKK